MDLSAFNINTVIMLALAIGLAYLGISVFKSVGRIVCFMLGVLLILFVLKELGVSIPIVSDVLDYFFDALEVVVNNFKDFLGRVTS